MEGAGKFILPLALIAAFLLWVYVYIPYEVKSDAKAIKKDGAKDSLLRKWHITSAVKTGILGAAVSAPFLFFSYLIPIAVFIGLLSLFWLLFDRGLNRARGLSDEYVGKTADIDAWFQEHFHDPKYPDYKTLRGFLRFKYWFLYRFASSPYDAMINLKTFCLMTSAAFLIIALLDFYF